MKTEKSSLKNKIALVSGASRGIGRSIALHLAGEGATVIACGRSKTKLHSLIKELNAIHDGGHIPIAADLQESKTFQQIATDVKKHFKKLDILVNNAGQTLSAAFEKTNITDFDRVIGINTKAPYFLTQALLPLLKKPKRTFIINVASVVAVKGYSHQTAYSASKHALRGFSIALANELHGSGIRVHVICPGGVDTEMVSRVRPDIKKDELIGPDEIARLVVFLVTQTNNAMIDDIHIRRQSSAPWF